MEYALELEGVSKRYRERDVLKGVSMQVQPGKVYGFLGRNGAGKTTTIRIIMGLVKANAGSVRLLNRDVLKDRRSAMRAIGAIIESPAFYPNLTGTENLRITAGLFDADIHRIPEVLKIVDMQTDANRKVKTYSTGMRQRLGIANALVHDPKILILDEPTNGLDPSGVKDLRTLIKTLSQKLEITILVSSHILSEVEQVADTVGILHDGVIKDQFEMRELSLKEQTGLMLEVEALEKAVALLNTKEIQCTVSADKLLVQCERAQNTEVNQLLTSGGIEVLNMNPVRDSLEDRFFAVAGGDRRTLEGVAWEN